MNREQTEEKTGEKKSKYMGSAAIRLLFMPKHKRMTFSLNDITITDIVFFSKSFFSVYECYI